MLQSKSLTLLHRINILLLLLHEFGEMVLAEARDLLAECLRQNNGDPVAQIYWERLSIARLRS